MKVGDLVYVVHGIGGWREPEVGIIIEPFGSLIHNSGKAWRVLMPNGTVRSRLRKHLTLVEK